MRKYCRKMKKRRVNFSLLRANEVGIRRLCYLFCGLQSLEYARFVVVHWPVYVFPLGSVRVSTGLCTCFHRPVETRTLPYGQQLVEQD